MIQITDTVKHLIIINVIFYVATMVFKEPFYDLFAFHFPKNDLFKPWQYVTHMFMHSKFSTSHILFNMIGLWMFGSTVEQILGKQHFLFLYFSAGIGAALFSTAFDYIQFTMIYDSFIQAGAESAQIETLINTGSARTNANLPQDKINEIVRIYNTAAVGASGALFGIMVAFATLQPKVKIGMFPLPIMVEARFIIAFLIISDLFLGILRVPGDNVGRLAHVGGGLIGFVIIWYWKKNQFKRWN